jgi:hypothetical protein
MVKAELSNDLANWLLSTADRLPAEIGNELRSTLVAALMNRAPLQLVRLGPGLYSTAAGQWEPKAEGVAAVLAALVASPGQWVDLSAERSRHAWLSAFERSRQSLRSVDRALAQALQPSPRACDPGMRLRQSDHGLQARWRPPARAFLQG